VAAHQLRFATDIRFALPEGLRSTREFLDFPTRDFSPTGIPAPRDRPRPAGAALMRMRFMGGMASGRWMNRFAGGTVIRSGSRWTSISGHFSARAFHGAVRRSARNQVTQLELSHPWRASLLRRFLADRRRRLGLRLGRPVLGRHFALLI